MKKNFLWMLAAILFCGAIATVFTACGDSDDDDPTPTPTPQPDPKEYTVTLDLVMHERTFNIMTLDFIYTDANGNENTMQIDKSKSPNAQLTEMEKKFFEDDPTLSLYRGEEAEAKYPGINDYLDTSHLKVFRVTLNKVAVGKIIKTTAKTYILDSYTPKETNDYELMPAVFITRSNSSKFLSSATLVMRFFGAHNWESLKAKMNGKELATCMNVIEIQ